MTTADELLDSIFGSTRPSLYRDFEHWVRDSRRFRSFALTYHAKIRSKIKSVRDARGMEDLHAELETAVVLLRSERFTLEYEKYAASKQRGPDFTVTYRTHTLFNVEVRRIRPVELQAADAGAHIYKLMAVLCEKVGQMPPSIVNLLWLHAGDELADADLTLAITTLRQLVESQADELFARRGFQNASDFARQYQRLSGIIVRQPEHIRLRLNPLARHQLPSEIANVLQRL